jgi:DNA-binding MarR family transcriptional regulator
MLYMQDMTGSRPAAEDEAALAGRAREVGAQCLAFAARRTANLVGRTYAAHLAPHGLEMPQFAILCVLAAAGRVGSARELAARLGLERSTLTRGLDRLLRAGLVARAPGEGGGRRVSYRLTASGRARLASALPAWEAAQRALLDRLPQGAEAPARRALDLLRDAARDLIGPDA